PTSYVTSRLSFSSVHTSTTPQDLHSFPTRRSSDLKQPEIKIPKRDSSHDRKSLPVEVILQHRCLSPGRPGARAVRTLAQSAFVGDRKSTRLNSSHGSTSYAVFCLKKKTLK